MTCCNHRIITAGSISVLTCEDVAGSAPIPSSDACSAGAGSGVRALGRLPASEADFGEGILLMKVGPGTATGLVFCLGAGVGMRVRGAQNLASSPFSMANRPLPGFPALACRQHSRSGTGYAARRIVCEPAAVISALARLCEFRDLQGRYHLVPDVPPDADTSGEHGACCASTYFLTEETTCRNCGVAFSAAFAMIF